MRTALIVEALAKCYAVTLIVVPPLGADQIDMPPRAADCCEWVQTLSGGQVRRWLARGGSFQLDRCEAFERVHVCRLAMAPLVSSVLSIKREGRPVCALDLDDYESKKYRRFAALLSAGGFERRAAEMRWYANQFGMLERTYLPRFDRVYLCQEGERKEVEELYPLTTTMVIPNAVGVPERLAPEVVHDVFTFLFVGTLDYYPNQDAITWFCRDILPAIRKRAGCAVRLLIVGSSPSNELLRLGTLPGVSVMADVPTLSEAYASANTVVVPVRTGGGTRIKLLEAFSYQRAVISTTLGAEGLELSHGAELLIADRVDDFATQCVNLLCDSTMRRSVARRGYDWVRRFHTPKQILRCVKQDLEESLSSGESVEISCLDFPTEWAQAVREGKSHA